ncbi:MAG: HDOD domain-containing protein [Desulfobulbaceae bacterium]|nr:MAG: HDOD domain-containing protein [Desulfobulbaceae bacterium]
MDEDLQKRELERKEAFIRLSSVFTLPSPSGTVMELIRLCNSESSSLGEIGEIIQADPALSAEILKYANSSLMSAGVQVASVQNATVRLGMKNIVNLALGLSVLADNREGNCPLFDYDLFWRSSLAQALAAREIARCSNAFNPDELYVCGLLATIGNLTLATIYPEEYAQLLTDQPPNTAAKSEERARFGIDGGELTSELLLSWGIPVHYALAAGFHQDLAGGEFGTGQTSQIAVLLNLAGKIARLCQSEEPLLELFQEASLMAREFEIDAQDFSPTFQTIVEIWQEQGKVFDIETVGCHRYQDEM